MDNLARFALRHKRLVIGFWILVFLGGILAAGATSKRLKVDFALPGQPGYETQKKIVKLYGNGNDSPVIPVVTVGSGTVEQHEQQVAAVFAALRSALPDARVVDYTTTHNAAFLTADHRSTFGLVYQPLPKSFSNQPFKKVERAVSAQAFPGVTVKVTGQDPLREGNKKVTQGGKEKTTSVLTETLLGGVGALVVLGFVFASFLALLPLIVAAVSILGSFLILLPITYVTSVSFVVQFLIALIGLGVAIDYSLLLVTRWREERDHGRSNDDAIAVAVQTAGHAVLFSGVTVAVGLAALVVLPVPGIRSMGFGGMLIPIVSTLVVLTLLPAILSSIGPRIDWPRVRHEDRASRAWSAWARGVVRHRWLAAGIAIAALGLLIAPVFDLKAGLPASSSLARQGTAYEALQTLEKGGDGTGVLTPMEVLVRTDQGGDPAAVAATVSKVDGVRSVVVPGQWRKDGAAVVEAFPSNETVAGTSSHVVSRVKNVVKTLPGVVGVGGIGAIQIDYGKAVYGNFPLVLVVLVIVTFLLLARAFRSILLSVKAVLLNLVSLAATFGAMVFFWQQGHGSGTLFNTSATGAITFWVPILVFAFLYGLSMDYEVFILSRTREEYDATGDTNGAVIEGLGRTGRLVTSAALILFLAFASLASNPQTDLKVMATGLGAGILLDATVVRALLVPALVSLFGSWNWWLPDRFAKLLRVRPSHALALRQSRDAVREPVQT